MILRYIDNKILPVGYQQVEYIESTGTEYIDTGYSNINATTNRYEVKFQYVNVRDSFLFGSLYGTNFRFGNIFRQSNNVAIMIGANKYAQTTYRFYDYPNIRVYDYELDINHTDNTYKGQLGTNEIPLTDINGSAKGDYNFTLFRGIAGFSNAIARIWKFKIYEDDVLVRNFIPCINPNGEVGLYDTVTNQFFGNNSSSGAFIAGNIVPKLKKVKEIKRCINKPNIPIEYTELEYTKSTNQWINLGINSTSTMSIDVKFYAENYAYKNIIGAENSSNSAECRLGLQNNANRPFYNEGVELELNTTHTCGYNDEGKLYLDDNVFSRTIQDTNYPLYVFALNRAGLTADYNQPTVGLRIYYIHIYDNIDGVKVPVMLLVPARRNSDGKVGFYDKISKQFFYHTTTANNLIEGDEFPTIKNVAKILRYINTIPPLNIDKREIVKTSVYLPSSIDRPFDINQMYLRCAYNGYMGTTNNKLWPDVLFEDNTLKVRSKENYYGVGIPINVIKDTPFTLECDWSNIDGYDFWNNCVNVCVINDDGTAQSIANADKTTVFNDGHITCTITPRTKRIYLIFTGHLINNSVHYLTENWFSNLKINGELKQIYSKE